MIDDSNEIDGGEVHAPQEASLGAKVGVAFTLTVHMADGTSKDIQCVGQVTGMEKEQDDGNLRS